MRYLPNTDDVTCGMMFFFAGSDFFFAFFLLVVDSKSRAAGWSKWERIPRPIEHETTVHYYNAQQLPNQNPRRCDSHAVSHCLPHYLVLVPLVLSVLQPYRHHTRMQTHSRQGNGLSICVIPPVCLSYCSLWSANPIGGRVRTMPKPPLSFSYAHGINCWASQHPRSWSYGWSLDGSESFCPGEGQQATKVWLGRRGAGGWTTVTIFALSHRSSEDGSFWIPWTNTVAMISLVFYFCFAFPDPIWDPRSGPLSIFTVRLLVREGNMNQVIFQTLARGY